MRGARWSVKTILYNNYSAWTETESSLTFVYLDVHIGIGIGQWSTDFKRSEMTSNPPVVPNVIRKSLVNRARKSIVMNMFMTWIDLQLAVFNRENVWLKCIFIGYRSLRIIESYQWVISDFINEFAQIFFPDFRTVLKSGKKNLSKSWFQNKLKLEIGKMFLPIVASVKHNVLSQNCSFT